LKFLISILGLQIGLLQFLQLVTTAAIIAIYTVSVSLRDQKAYNLGERHSCILISFLIKYHPKINQLSEIIKISKYSYSRLLVSEFEAFQESGELPVQRKERVSTLLFRHLFWAAISPIGAFLFFIMTIRDEMQHKNQRVIHTE